MTGASRALIPAASTGGLVERDGAAIGSALTAQGFASPAYLHPRPSASGWNAAGTGATNLSPTSAALVADVAARAAAFEALNGQAAPIEAVTTSDSGLDPDVSPETALAQVRRIAAARNADPAEVARVVKGAARGPWLGLYGPTRINVLEANTALDAAVEAPKPVAL